MKGPSIAVMLGGHASGGRHDDEGDPEGEQGDLSLSETKARAEDAATAFADAVEAKDARRIVKAFCALGELCRHLEELEESGESEEEEGKEGEKDDDSDEE